MFRELHLVLCPFELGEYLGDVALVLFVSQVVLFSQIISSAVPEMSLDGIEDRPGIIYWSRMTIPIQNIPLLLEDLLADFERLRWLFAVDLEHLLTGVRVIGHLPLLRVFSEVFHEDHFLLVFKLSVLGHKLPMDLIVLKIRLWIQKQPSVWVPICVPYLGTKINVIHNLLIECPSFLLF